MLCAYLLFSSIEFCELIRSAGIPVLDMMTIGNANSKVTLKMPSCSDNHCFAQRSAWHTFIPSVQCTYIPSVLQCEMRIPVCSNNCNDKFYIGMFGRTVLE